MSRRARGRRGSGFGRSWVTDPSRKPKSPSKGFTRGFEGSYQEGGIRVPLFVRWPGVVKPGTRSDVPVNQVDLYPTILAAARVA